MGLVILSIRPLSLIIGGFSAFIFEVCTYILIAILLIDLQVYAMLVPPPGMEPMPRAVEVQSLSP